ncbi:MAG TPA: transglycosylase SLT domain-containing protein [Pyrinomonadaceae bacterium]|nr:transglycosylase SLT domain-containing protein [Pyrinomonadaceae bacterium]
MRESRAAAAIPYLKLFSLVALAGWVLNGPVTQCVTRPVEPVQTPLARPALQSVQSRHAPAEVEALIRASARKYGLPEERVVYIAWRESKFQPGARSKSGRYVGLYQFDLVTWRNTPEGRAGLSREDPVANINAAHWHMKRYGFQAWAMPGQSNASRRHGKRRSYLKS